MPNAKIFFLAICLFGSAVLHAQAELERDVVTSAGSEFQQGTLELCWTLGEIATETYTNASLIITSGFQQGKPHPPVSVGEQALDAMITAYPNPTFDEVHLTVQTTENIRATLYSTDGKELSTLAIEPSHLSYTISLTHLPAGHYWLYLANDKNQFKTYHIQKINQ